MKVKSSDDVRIDYLEKSVEDLLWANNKLREVATDLREKVDTLKHENAVLRVKMDELRNDK